MCTQLMKCAAGDIVPSLTRLKKHGSKLKFFVSIFTKLNQINNIISRKVATFEDCEIFSNYYFPYVWDYEATMSGGNYIIIITKTSQRAKCLRTPGDPSSTKFQTTNCKFGQESSIRFYGDTLLTRI